jgi:hypothetical protein
MALPERHLADQVAYEAGFLSADKEATLPAMVVARRDAVKFEPM